MSKPQAIPDMHSLRALGLHYSLLYTKILRFVEIMLLLFRQEGCSILREIQHLEASECCKTPALKTNWNCTADRRKRELP